MKIDTKNLCIKAYTYTLPEEKIAKFPLARREDSKLLIYEQETIKEDTYEHISNYLPENTLLIFNNTKVVEARLLFQKNTGSTIEIFCLEPDDNYIDITNAMSQKHSVLWKCLVGGAKKWKEDYLEKRINDFILKTKIVEKRNDYFLIEFSWNKNLSFAEVLHIAGNIPLPPYLNRAVIDDDKNRYQTIYAQNDGSVAAPTAGLHFTENIFQKLAAKNIQKDFITLHVGAGTFKPIKTNNIAEHEMHAEYIEISISLLEKIKNNLDNNIIAVGTTSLRTLESIYWLGVKNIYKQNIKHLWQWECYELPQNIEAITAIESLINHMKEKNINTLFAKTQIMIAPGYQLKIAKALITNFHQPNSTLLLLIASIVGDNWKTIYNYALQHHFRFLSYGDGSLLWKKQ